MMQGMKELLEISPFTHTHWGNNNHWQNPTFTYVCEWWVLSSIVSWV